MIRSRKQTIAGWGRRPVQTCFVTAPSSIEALRDAVIHGDSTGCIARGLGRSYGDASLNEGGRVIDQTRLNRFIAFDSDRGELECEAGVSLAEIIKHLLPRGWFLPVTPGTKFVTVGGAIAADVHGKNHHVDGSFGNFVRRLRLMTASGEVIDCSPDQQADVFWATIGGMGLTGVILSAVIQLRRVESAYCDLTVRPTRDLDQTLERFSETDRDYEYSVAWIDCLASGKSLGRSVMLLANEARVDQLPAKLRTDPLRFRSRRNKSVPFNLPPFVLNSWTVKAFNGLYYATHPDRRAIVDYESFFYPLDHVHHWNRLYGKRGFVQYQALIPRTASRAALVEMLEKVSAAGAASFLAVLKSSGPADKGMLSYLFDGHTLALDLPYTGKKLAALTRQLDEILLKHGGRIYLAKDAMTSADAFAVMYSRLNGFRTIKNRLDPQQRFVSSQARRVGIVERS